jgi:hypothetical protein
LDLDPIKVKLMHKESGEGWTLEYANKVETEYRRHLYLMKMFPGETAPVVDVDTFWHYHILDTMKYAADCDAVFGYFLHHFPYIGMRGEVDAAALQQMGVRAQQLYEETFGEPCPLLASEPVATAWCSETVTQAGSGTQATAWCSETVGRPIVIGQQPVAWCSTPVTQTLANKMQASAWCSDAVTHAAPRGKQTIAWCSTTVMPAIPSGKQAAAWCSDTAMQTRPAGAQAVAWCSDGRMQAIGRFYTERPSLATT